MLLRLSNYSLAFLWASYPILIMLELGGIDVPDTVMLLFVLVIPLIIEYKYTKRLNKEGKVREKAKGWRMHLIEFTLTAVFLQILISVAHILTLFN